MPLSSLNGHILAKRCGQQTLHCERSIHSVDEPVTITCVVVVIFSLDYRERTTVNDPIMKLSIMGGAYPLSQDAAIIMSCVGTKDV